MEPLQVTDSLMAVAEIHSDRSSVEGSNLTHYRDYNVSENICSGDLEACYYGEKEQFAADQDWNHNTGHYLNMVSSSNKVTGASDFVQEFDTDTEWLAPADEIKLGDFSQGRVMSVDDYEADVEAYKAPLDKAVSDYDNAAKAADNAKTAYDRAKAAADAWNNAMFTVSFDTGGGSDVKAQTVRRGGTVSKPTDPTRAGYLFGGWYQATPSTTSPRPCRRT